ncbi:hypothetical protein BCR39DRAFT_543081 [Naematelia encephala]|uniref:Uncharacterized protein n=1 Tax=Naematelia encephala TaxID=71784 RepID=A0A1Y2AT24_9TREE|nr:hypothetical protein BCR39DRAFT_543081 [Naematelia encephala]
MTYHSLTPNSLYHSNYRSCIIVHHHHPSPRIMPEYIPSRPAPLPPVTSTEHLPPTHPFASHYVPPHPTTHSPTARAPSRICSNSTSTSNSDTCSSPSFLPSLKTPSTRSTSSSSIETPSFRTSSFFSHKSNSRSNFFHDSNSKSKSYKPSISTRHTDSIPPSIGLGFGILDHRPRYTLLSDLEVILNKRVEFTLIRKYISSRKSTLRENDNYHSHHLEKAYPYAKLGVQQSWDCEQEGVVVIDKETDLDESLNLGLGSGSRREESGRLRRVRVGGAARDGNWI